MRRSLPRPLPLCAVLVPLVKVLELVGGIISESGGGTQPPLNRLLVLLIIALKVSVLVGWFFGGWLPPAAGLSLLDRAVLGGTKPVVAVRSRNYATILQKERKDLQY